MTVPTFLGLGAQRCGTTWLDANLRTHPKIYLPRRRKEVHFFDRHYERGLAWYERFFPEPREACDFAAMGEITPMYLYDPQVPGRIRELLPDCRFLVMLRNPVDRAFSQYAYVVRNTAERRGFAEFLRQENELIARGMYREQLERYFALFPRDRFLVLVFEQVMSDPLGALQRIAPFLGVDPAGFTGNLLGKPINASNQVRLKRAFALARRLGGVLRDNDMDWIVHAAKRLRFDEWFGRANEIAPLAPKDRAALGRRYGEEIGALERLLGMKLDVWRPCCSRPRRGSAAKSQ